MGAHASKRKELALRGTEVSFDHFQVLRAIGRGSFGKVCIVQKRDSQRMYAMKYMNKAQCEEKQAVGNVFKEIEILSSLSHPFLVNLWFSFQDEEDMFMVVDLLLGGDLRYHVQQGINFTDSDVRLYIMEIGSALEYLHTRNIIHRDIKPDNLLLDEEGHVHLSDFNIATVLENDKLATSMSGTKPYMAPEVFDCVMNRCDGYSFSVDWWSLGVAAYEIRKGRRPYDIQSGSSLEEIRVMFLSPPRFPHEWSLGFVHLITKLLTISSYSRIGSLDALLRIPYVSEVDMDKIMEKEIAPHFVPPKDHLNCDPTFELEEMIIESKPLHKKNKRLKKQRSIRESMNTAIPEPSNLAYDAMLIFNRETEQLRKEMEKRELEWQEELDRSMRLSDPTGHGCSYAGSLLSSSKSGSIKEERGTRDKPLTATDSTLKIISNVNRRLSRITSEECPLPNKPDAKSQESSSGSHLVSPITSSFSNCSQINAPSQSAVDRALPSRSISLDVGETQHNSGPRLFLKKRNSDIQDCRNLTPRSLLARFPKLEHDSASKKIMWQQRKQSTSTSIHSEPANIGEHERKDLESPHSKDPKKMEFRVQKRDTRPSLPSSNSENRVAEVPETIPDAISAENSSDGNTKRKLSSRVKTFASSDSFFVTHSHIEKADTHAVNNTTYSNDEIDSSYSVDHRRKSYSRVSDGLFRKKIVS